MATRKDQLREDPRAKLDADLLKLCLEHDGLDDCGDDAGSPREVFEGWAARLKANGCARPLSDKQRSWLEGVASRLGVEAGAQNLVSSGAVVVKPKERESLQQFLGSLDRPALPPHRRKP